MNNIELKEILNTIQIPNSDRTLGNVNSIELIDTASETLIICLTFKFPIEHIRNKLHDLISKKLKLHNFNQIFKIEISTNIATHQVQNNVTTIKGVKNIIAVASGKGGVGKSTTTTNLAIALSEMGAKVGVLDADLYGPSQPKMFGVQDQAPKQKDGKFIPVISKNGIQVMSIGLLIDTNQAVAWRGPMVSQALQQLLFQTEWNNIDYLFIDLPPGTGDIQLTLSQKIPVTGSIIVTTPQDIALIDAQKAINMFNKVNISIIGILENMSTHICSHCGHIEPIFGINGGKELASELDVPLLGQLPLNIKIREAMDNGHAFELFKDHHNNITEIYNQAAFVIALTLADKSKDFSHRFPKIVVE